MLLLVDRAERGELGEVGFEFGGGYVKSPVKMTVLRTYLAILVNYDDKFVGSSMFCSLSKVLSAIQTRRCASRDCVNFT